MNDTPPNIRDVALAAGVSTATVSRTLSSPEKVAETTRDAVMRAVEASGYRVNVAARNLRQRKSGSIVILVPNLGNPFFSQIIGGIEAEASPAGYNVLVADSSQPHLHRNTLHDYLRADRADGIICLDASMSARIEQSGNRKGRPPLIQACERAESSAAVSITIDNEHGARLAIRHLLALGHKQIGYGAGPTGNVLTLARQAGAVDEAARHGVDMRGFIFDGDFSLESGVAIARRWAELRERPTALFFSSDMMACGFIAEARRLGFSTPHDVSVIGFDDIEISAHFVPALTTVRQPREAIGRQAARMLLAAIDDPSRQLEPAVMPIELIVRGSCAAPPATKR